MVDLLERRAFVGRERELARLVTVLAAVEHGSGRTAVLAGEAGIGKSSVLARFEDLAADRARSETGACLPMGSGALPYGPFVEILRRIVATVEPATLPALLGPGRGVLSRLLPAIALRDAEVVAAVEADPTAQSRLFELILGIFHRLAREQPLVLGVEDIQWADRSTRELLAFLVRGLRDDRVLIVVTVRSEADETSGATLELLAELERDEGVERIELEPFDRNEVADQCGALLPDGLSPDMVDRVFERSDGNPFFVEELVLAGATAGAHLPAVVRDILAVRLADLSDQTREILRAAALGGPDIDEALLADALGPERRVPAALREAIDAGILERSRSGGGPMFRHQLLREAVEHELFPTERQAGHHAYAQALVRRLAAGRAVAVEDLARHWDGAGEPARALRPMLEAARAAEAVFAWPEALERWQRTRALFGLVPEAEVVAGMGAPEINGLAADCAVLAGDYRAAIQLGRAAIEAVDARTDPTLAGMLHNRLRWYLWESGDRRGAAEAVAAALRLIPAEPASQARAAALAQQAGIVMFAGRYGESMALAREAIAMAQGLEAPGELALASGILGWDLAALGDVEAGIERFREGQAIARAIQSPEGISLAAINLVTLLDQLGRSRDQLENGLAAADEMERLGVSRTYGAMLLGYVAKAQLMLGLWDEVDRTTVTALRRGAAERPELWLSINRARLLIGRGRITEAERLLERCRALERRLGGTEFWPSLLLAEAELGVWSGDLGATRRTAKAGLELGQGGGVPDVSIAWLAILVLQGEADAMDGDADGSLVDEIERAVRHVLVERPDVRSGERVQGFRQLLLAERSRLDKAPDPAAWQAVAASFATIEWPYTVAYARFREAEAAIASHGSRASAGVALREARTGAARLAARPLLDRIEAFSKAARLSMGEADGSPGAIESAADPYGFTPREREVLELVSDGRTNQQIAEQLFIARKTASVHVSNIMAKLGASNRSEAAAMARRLGLTR